MDFLVPEPETAPYQLEALATIASAAGSGLADPQLAMLEALQRVLLQTSLDIETLKPITPEELARHVGDPGQARQLIRLMVATSLADGPPSLEQVSKISAFARATGVNEPAVDVIRHLARGRRRRFQIAFMRRSHVRTYLRNSRSLLGGVRPLIKSLLVARGLVAENTELSSRFRALETFPEETLGHRFFEHCIREGLPFAGEKGGFPIGALFHDFAHVLGGYDTTPEGEMKNAAFQAGFTQADDDFFTMLFAIVIHTAGINLTPFDMPVVLGRIAQGDLAREVLCGWQRGAAMKIDLGRDWDFWEFVALPIEVVRARFGITPLAALDGAA